MQTKLKIAPARSISIADAKAMREIAIDFWGNFQSSLTQMFGWDAPGTNYDRPTIEKWLESQEQLVCDRIGQLMRGTPDIETTTAEPAPNLLPGDLAIVSGEKPWSSVIDDYFVGQKVEFCSTDENGDLLVKLAGDESDEPCLYRTHGNWLVCISSGEGKVFDRMLEAESCEEILMLSQDSTVKRLLKIANHKTRNKFLNANKIPDIFPAKPNNRRQKQTSRKIA